MEKREGAGGVVGDGGGGGGVREVCGVWQEQTQRLEAERRARDAKQRGSEMGRIRTESGPGQAAVPTVGSRPEPRPQGPQAALRGGGGGEGSRSERQRSRVCVFIIIISD